MELTELGQLLDEIDKAAEGDSNDAEIDALQTALEYAVGLLIEEGHTIPRQ